MAVPRSVRRIASSAVVMTLLTSTAVAVMSVSVPSALAAGTVLFDQPFHDNTVDGPAGSVTIPATPTKTNVACLSAAGNSVSNPLASCAAPTDAQGSGKLRLTSNAAGLEGGIFASTSVPTSQGLDVTFNSYQYGGSSPGADGIAFVLAAVDPANPVTPSVIGQSGGALGYSAQSSNQTGLSHGYLGVGLDAFGNFSNKFEGTGCTDPANIAQRMPGQVVIRGPGNGTVGYCALQSSAATATSPPLTLRATTRAASLVPVEVVYNPSSSSVTTASGLVVPAGDYDVTFTPVSRCRNADTVGSCVDPQPAVKSLSIAW
jgi:Bacterial lectin